MLRRITIVLMTIVCMVCTAQTTVSSYKYWMDSNFSGAKTGTTTGAEVSFDADISGQSEGVHFLYVMLQDSEGSWGKLHRFMYYIPGSQIEVQGTKLKSIEYWMDGDFASRKAESTDKSTIPLSIDIGSMKYGIHTMSYRVINDIGQYGPMKTFTYYITPSETFGSSVASVDYWIDGGYDSRSTMTAIGNDITLSDIDISGLSEGVHFFYVQPKDNLGRLGKVHRYMFFVPLTATIVEGTKVTDVEYWIDNNFSGRKNLATTDATVPIEVDIKDLSGGQHTFSYRIKNDLGEYSDIRRKTFYIGQEAEEMSLGGYEYWIDDQYESRNIGSASGTSEEISISDINISSLSEGVHFFYVRTLNSNDQYGKLHRFMFYVPMNGEEEQAATLTNMEYWIDGDMSNKATLKPGATTTPISIDVSEMKYGLHTFSYRAANSNGTWGPVVNKNFYVNDKDYSVVSPLTAYRYFINDRKGEDKIASTTQYSDDIVLSIPSSKVVPIDLKACQFEINSPEEGKVTMNRDVTYQFALQFQNSNGEWNAPADTTFIQPETVTYDVAQLDVNGAYTVKKPADGDIVAVKIEVPEAGTYYTHSAQKCSMGIFNPDGTIKFSVLPSEMKAGYGEYYEAGTYYGVVYNAVKDGDNPEDNITVRFSDSSIKIAQLMQRVENNVMYLTCATEGVTIYYTMDGSTPTTESTVYTGEGIKLSGNCRVQAIAVKDGMLSSEVLSYNYEDFTVATPVIEVDNLKIKITTATEGAAIYYTIDESSPLTDGFRYTSPIPFNENITVSAVAKKENFNTSEVVKVQFTKNEYTCQKPSLTKDGKVIKAVSATENANIYYTLDGSDPTVESNVYDNEKGIELTENCTVKAIAAIKDKMFNSDIATYDITDFKVETPVIKVVNKKVVIESATSGATIYYNMSYDYPTRDNSLRYTGPIDWDENTYVSAIAVKDNFNDSELAREYFEVVSYKCKNPVFNHQKEKLYVTTNTDGATIYYSIDGSDPLSAGNVYPEEGLTLTHNCTVKAVAVYDGALFNSDISTIEITDFTVAEPVITLEGIKVVLTCATDGAQIYYTTDGSVPSKSNGKLYTDPIAWADVFSIYAIAVKDNFNDSPKTYKTFYSYEYQCDAPQFERDENTMYITSETEGATIHYTLDGSTPTPKSPVCPSTGITLTQNGVVKAIAALEGKLFSSDVKSIEVTHFFVIEPTYQVVNKKIELSCATEGAKIYYTVNNSPEYNNNDIPYTGPIEWTEDFRLYAYAQKDNFNNSGVVNYRFSVSAYRCGKPVITRKDDKLIVTTSTEGAKIYYTTDGTTPTSSSTPYPADGIAREFNCTVKAIAIKDGELFDSEVTSFVVDGFKVEDPTLTVENLKIVLSCATPDAQIYYTTESEEDVMANGILYSEPLDFTEDVTVRFYAKKKNFEDSYVKTQTLKTSTYTCRKPTFIVQKGTAANGYKNKVTVVSADEGTIHYTLDGNDPSFDSPSRVTGSEIDLVKNCVIQAVAEKSGMFQSVVASYTIDFIKAETPVIKFDETTKQLTITCATPDAKIFYTIGGETPSATSIEYEGALTIFDNKEIKAIAIADDYLNSSVASYKPTYFACDPITVEYDGRSVEFNCTTEGAQIYYTTNGYTPSANANLYDGNAIMLDGITTVKAIGMKTDMKNSTVTFEPTAYYNGGKTYVTKAGDLEKAYAWCGKEKVVDVTIEGNVNAADFATIRTMKAARYLDLSEAVVEESKLPEKAFEGMDLISFVSPRNIIETGDMLIKDAKSIGAVVWNADIAVPENLTGDITPVNALLYVNTDDLKGGKFRNVVVNGVAGDIVLSDADDASNFYCPIEFTADKISYRHTYTLPTEKGVLTGWEALALPFTPTSIVHSVNKECVPFKMYDPSTDKKPFWLCEMTSVGFAPADKIQANKGYIVCMPNNEDYSDEYILGGNGDITYMAENAVVPVTSSVYDDPATMGDYIFRPNYMHLAQSDTVMVINKTDYGSNRPGSVFVPNLRKAYPFESYVTKTSSSSANASPLRIDAGLVGIMETLYGMDDVNKSVYSEDGALFIYSKTAGRVKIYKVNGVLYKTVDVQAGWTKITDLSKDVYIVKGRKVIIK